MDKNSAAQPATRSKPTDRPRRMTAVFVAAAAAAATVWRVGPFLTWAGRHNDIYYAAAELGRRPQYPAAHYPTGLALGSALAVSIAVGALAVAFALAPAAPWRLKAVVLASLAAFTLGASVPAWLISPAYGALPLLAAGALTLALLARRSGSLSASRAPGRRG